MVFFNKKSGRLTIVTGMTVGDDCPMVRHRDGRSWKRLKFEDIEKFKKNHVWVGWL